MSSKLISTPIGLAALSAFVWATVAAPTSALAGTATGACQQAGKAAAIAFFDSPNDTENGSLGDAIADGFFGNEPNLTNTDTNLDLGPEEVDPGSSAGSVVGSASPGPATIGGGFVTWGSVVAGATATNCAGPS